MIGVNAEAVSKINEKEALFSGVANYMTRKPSAENDSWGEGRLRTKWTQSS